MDPASISGTKCVASANCCKVWIGNVDLATVKKAVELAVYVEMMTTVKRDHKMVRVFHDTRHDLISPSVDKRGALCETCKSSLAWMTET